MKIWSAIKANKKSILKRTLIGGGIAVGVLLLVSIFTTKKSESEEYTEEFEGEACEIYETDESSDSEIVNEE